MVLQAACRPRRCDRKEEICWEWKLFTEKAAGADMKVHINALMVERSVAYLGSILPDVLRIMPTAAPEEPVEKIKV